MKKVNSIFLGALAASLLMFAQGANAAAPLKGSGAEQNKNVTATTINLWGWSVGQRCQGRDGARRHYEIRWDNSAKRWTCQSNAAIRHIR